MKILHISGARSWGGNEQQLIDVIPELEVLGVQNQVLCVANSPLDNKLKSLGIKTINSKKAKLNKFVNYKYLKRIVKDLKPDLLHLHTSDSLTVFTVSNILFGLKTPAVFSKKGIGGSMSALSIFKYNYRGISNIICVSEYVRQQMKDDVIKPKNHHKLSVVYDSVNEDRIYSEKNITLKDKYQVSQTYSIGNIANHVKAKNLKMLVEVLNQLVNTLNYTDAHVFQLGEFKNEITEQLKDLVKDYGLEDYITFAGFTNDASSYIPQFDVYVMTSEREGGPSTILEAFCQKTPVISTKVGVVPEAIKDGENGFIVDVNDYERMALKLKTLLENDEMKQTFAKKSHDIFKNEFTASQMAKRTLDIYKSVIR